MNEYFLSQAIGNSVRLLLRRTLVLLDYILSFYRSLPTTRALPHVAKQLKTVLLIFN